MKLVIFGLSLSSSWGNGHATLWRGLCRALTERGHSVVFLEKDVPYHARNRDLTVLDGGELIIYQDWNSVRGRAEEHLAAADAGIITSYCPDALAAQALLLRARSSLRVFYDLDTPVTLARLARGEAVDYVGPRGLRDYDLVLSCTGGRALQQLRSVLGAREAHALYGSVDPAIHRPTAPEHSLYSDLSYLGTYAEDRQEALTRFFLEPASLLPERKFLLAGSLYPQNFPWRTNLFYRQHLAPAAHPAFYCSSRLTLNITRASMARSGHAPSVRLFEAAACGVPLISNPWLGLDQFFEPGTEILVAHETQDVVRYLNLSDSALEKIARAGRDRVLAFHTARHRAQELESLLERARNGSLRQSQSQFRPVPSVNTGWRG